MDQPLAGFPNTIYNVVLGRVGCKMWNFGPKVWLSQMQSAKILNLHAALPNPDKPAWLQYLAFCATDKPDEDVGCAR